MKKIGIIKTSNSLVERIMQVIQVEDQYYAGVDAFAFPEHEDKLKSMATIVIPGEWDWLECYEENPSFYKFKEDLSNTYKVIKGQEAKEKFEQLLLSTEIGILTLNDHNSGYPYAIPINHAWDGKNIIMHCGKIGKKLGLIRKDNMVTYCVCQQTEPNVKKLLTCHLDYASAIIHGKIRISEDPEEKERAVESLTSYYQAPYHHGYADQIDILVLEVEYMTLRNDRFKPNKERKIYYYKFED